jgi:hypothetical protein
MKITNKGILAKITDSLKFQQDAARPISAGFSRFASSGEIEEIFESGPEKGPKKKYFCFVDEMRIPAKRAFAAKDIYQEFEYRTNKDMLLGFCKSVYELCDEGSLTKVAALTGELEKRLGYVTHIDLLYKLASVLYFDETENPEDYDQAYNFKKIQNWQQDEDVAAFFLKTPLIEYLPFSTLSNIDLAAFTNGQREEEKQHLIMLSRILSKNPENKELATVLKLQAETLQNLINSLR